MLSWGYYVCWGGIHLWSIIHLFLMFSDQLACQQRTWYIWKYRHFTSIYCWRFEVYSKSIESSSSRLQINMPPPWLLVLIVFDWAWHFQEIYSSTNTQQTYFSTFRPTNLHLQILDIYATPDVSCRVKSNRSIWDVYIYI